MTSSETEKILSKVQAALEADHLNCAIQILQTLKPVDQADVFEDLDDDDQASLLPSLESGVSADILENIEDEDAARLVSHLSPDDAVRIVNEMEPDEAADLLGDIQPRQAQEILSQMDHPEEVRPLLLHPALQHFLRIGWETKTPALETGQTQVLLQTLDARTTTQLQKSARADLEYWQDRLVGRLA